MAQPGFKYDQYHDVRSGEVLVHDTALGDVICLSRDWSYRERGVCAFDWSEYILFSYMQIKINHKHKLLHYQSWNNTAEYAERG
jgi:hypothetical protein